MEREQANAEGVAQNQYRSSMADFRIGQGFDVHRFAAGRKLFLGGVEIPFEMGLLGHSDADVLIHAMADALLGALALGDIGVHFPDNDQQYKDIDSKILLKKAYSLIKEKGYRVVNIDNTLMLEKPKVSKYSAEMKQVLSDILEIDTSQISIKATTMEKMGFVGRQEGVAATSIVLLERRVDV